MTTILILTIDGGGQARAFEAIGAQTLRDRYEQLRRIPDLLLGGEVGRFEVAGVSIDVRAIQKTT